MRPLKIGLVGFGSWGRRHFESWRRVQEARVAGIYDPAHEGKRFFSSLDRLIDSVDAVDVVVPARSLARVAKEAIRAGKHVFIEKPMATNLREARDLVEYCQSHGDSYAMVGFIERFNPVFRKLHFAVRVLKKPNAIFCQRSGTPTLVAQQTGVLKDLAIHDVDLLRWLLGDPKWVVAQSIRGFHYGQLEMQFHGVRALVISDCLGPKVRRWILTFGERAVHAHFEGDRWRLFTDNVEIPIRWDPPLRRELRHFALCVMNGVPPTPSVLDGFRALQIIETGLLRRTTPSQPRRAN